MALFYGGAFLADKLGKRILHFSGQEPRRTRVLQRYQHVGSRSDTGLAPDSVRTPLKPCTGAPFAPPPTLPASVRALSSMPVTPTGCQGGAFSSSPLPVLVQASPSQSLWGPRLTQAGCFKEFISVTSCSHHRCHMDRPSSPSLHAGPLRVWLEGGRLPGPASDMGQSRDRGARSLGVPFSAARGVRGDRHVPLRAPGPPPPGRAFTVVGPHGAERVLGNDPFVHWFGMWRMSESRGAALSFLWPVCHTRSPKEGCMCSDRLLNILTGHCVNVIAVDSQNPGWRSEQFNERVGQRSGKKWSSSGRLCSPSYRPASLLATAECSVRAHGTAVSCQVCKQPSLLQKH